MTDALTLAQFDRLAGDAVLDGMLARTVFGDGTGPAIYTTMPPPTAPLPYVLAYGGAVSDVPRDTFDAEYREQVRDISCWAAKPDQGGGSVGEVNAIAERVRSLLHRQPLAVEGFRNLVAEVSGPVMNDDETAFGRVLSVRYLLAALAA